MHPDLDRILISRERIAQRVRELAGEIERTYAGNLEAGLTLVTVLSGATIFLADLIRELPLRMKIGLVMVSSYRGAATAPGEARVM
ncbi:MAG: hypoxanthine phosphoribosyltransferase, partial [Phycisphaerae bacterium]